MWTSTCRGATITSFITCGQQVGVRNGYFDQSAGWAYDVVDRDDSQPDLMFDFKRVHCRVSTAVVFDEASNVAILLAVNAHVGEDEGLLAVVLF